MLLEVCKNPKSPGFNHYLFESVAALIRHGTAADASQLTTYEQTLFPAFQIVLSNDIQEFHPYVFQIFAQLIELSNPPLGAVSLASDLLSMVASVLDYLLLLSTQIVELEFKGAVTMPGRCVGRKLL